MKIFLLITILILIVILVYQGKEIRELEKKTLDAFRIVCQKNRCTKGRQINGTTRRQSISRTT